MTEDECYESIEGLHKKVIDLIIKLQGEDTPPECVCKKALVRRLQSAEDFLYAAYHTVYDAYRGLDEEEMPKR